MLKTNQAMPNKQKAMIEELNLLKIKSIYKIKNNIVKCFLFSSAKSKSFMGL